MQRVDTEPAVRLVERLTRRESQMLAFLAEGYSRPEIAAKLTLGLTSVKFHIQHLYGKLGVNRKRQALDRALALGLLTGAGTPAPPAALRPAPRHNLPLQVTRFFGRAAELAQLSDRLDENRLVTLTGSGGVGKTRLSLRVAEDALGEFADGVWLVELAPLSDPDLVPRQVAAGLGLRNEPGRPSLETLTAYLRQRQVLLLLDNGEHLAEACARLAETLLRACPALKILATSREPLGVDGEAVFRVPSLPFPSARQPVTPEGLGEFPSVRLFVDRARLVLPDYALAAHNAEAIAHICRRLDGIPLALELAAARLKLLTAEQVARRLDEALDLLTTGRRTALPRHRTLRATIEWSYALLSPAERLLLERLAVFAGGCTLAAAEAICAGDGLEANQVLNLLTALVDKSLVIAERRQNTETRYRLLETVRQYAWEKLGAAGATARTQARHLGFFLALTQISVPDPNMAEHLEHRQNIAADLENVRQAVEWSLGEHYQAADGLRLLMRSIYDLSSLAEKLDWCQRGIALAESQAGVPPALLAELLLVARGFVVVDDPPGALALIQRAVEISRGLTPEQPALLLDCLNDLTDLCLTVLDEWDVGRAYLIEAQALFQRAVAEGRLPTPEMYAAQFGRQGFELTRHQGDYGAAKAHALESLRLDQVLGGRWGKMVSHRALGFACLDLAEYDQARDHFLAALDGAKTESAGWAQQGKSELQRWLGEVELRRGGSGSLERALDLCQQSLRLVGEVHDRNVIASGLGLAAAIAAQQGRPAHAARLAGASHALYARQGRKPWEDSSLDSLLPGWRAGPDQAALAEAFAAGQALPFEAAIALALAE